MTGRPTARSAVLEAARAYMAMGWAVFPVDGKVPATRHGVKDASTEERLARIWFERHPDRGVALATGRPSGVWALDLDTQEAVERLVELQREHGELPRTVASRTRKGYHLLFRMPAEGDVRNSASRVAEGIDVRGTGGYVVLPPSRHPTGTRYRWHPGRGPDELRPAHAPSWLLSLVQPDPEPSRPEIPSGSGLPTDRPHRPEYVRAAIEEECLELARTPEGRRNDRLNEAAFSLGRFVATGEADAARLADALTLAARQAGLGRREIRKTIDSAFKARGVR